MTLVLLALVNFFMGVRLGIYLGRRQVNREAATAALAKELASLRSIPFPILDRGCKLPPWGWFCSREPGHEGPCAAYCTMCRGRERVLDEDGPVPAWESEGDLPMEKKVPKELRTNPKPEAGNPAGS